MPFIAGAVAIRLRRSTEQLGTWRAITFFTCALPLESGGPGLLLPVTRSRRGRQRLSRLPRPTALYDARLWEPRSTSTPSVLVPATLASLPLQPMFSFRSLRLRKPSGAAGSPVEGLRERAGAGACARAPNTAGGARGGPSGHGTPGDPRTSHPSFPRPPLSSPFGIRFPSLEPGQRRTSGSV